MAARYQGPDGAFYTAPLTFQTKGDAQAYLSRLHTDITREVWLSPAARKAAEIPRFDEYATAWLSQRNLKPRTREHYAETLRLHVLPTFGLVPLDKITPAAVRTWHAGLITGPTARAHAYSLLRTIMGTAVADDIVNAQPCRLRGASKVERAVKIEPATLDELAAITEAMPARLQLIVQLSAWCALRFGEVSELRRRDVDLNIGLLRIRRGVVRAEGQILVASPKTSAGARDVHVPRSLLPMIKQHLRDHAQIGPDGLLFYGRNGDQLARSSLVYHFNRAAEQAGRPDLTPHGVAAHWSDLGRPEWRDCRRADGPARAHLPRDGAALSARQRRARSGPCFPSGRSRHRNTPRLLTTNEMRLIGQPWTISDRQA